MLEPGQIFASRYRVVRRIAEGGMGAIFEAEHTATERRVALKLLFPHIMSVASARKKFELEAKISARVNSPNIVEVLDAGFDEASKSPFLVMELLEGQTLAHHVRERGPLPFEQALPWLGQVAAGLDAAHGYKEPGGAAKPIIHRDLKPENLFLAREHGSVVVKILDFGIAKVLGETGNVSQEVRGTPLYMAFEQVTAGALSPQTDVWALGLIAYYMLTGSHYWRSASEPSASVQSLFAEILTLPLEAPSARLRQQSGSVQLPPAFDAWLLDCLQRDPSRRFASAGAAIEALARGVGGSVRPRPRLDSRPAGPLGLASTAAYQPPAGSTIKPLGTAASLPGMATERGSAPAPARGASKPRHVVPAAAAVVVLASLGWLVLGGGGGEPGAPAAGASPAAAMPEREGGTSAQRASAPAASAAPAGPSIAPAPSSEARVSPLQAAPTVAPAPEATRPGGATTPQVRVAPHDESAAAVIAASSGASDAPSAAGAVEAAPVSPASAPAREAPGAPAPSTSTASPTSPASTTSATSGVGAAPTERATPPSPVPREAAPPARAPVKKPTRNSDAYKMR